MKHARRLLAAALALSFVGCPAKGSSVQKPAGTPPTPTTATGTPATPGVTPAAAASDPRPDAKAIAAAKQALLAKHGDTHRARIERGVDQVASLWRASDGDLTEFAMAQFVAEPAALDKLFARFEEQLEQVDGHVLELGRSLRWHTDVDTGPMLPSDPLFAAFDPGAHVVEDMFASKAAFAALLNFPLTTLADRLRDGGGYTRRQWAEVRLTGRFDTRIPGDVTAAISAAAAVSDNYISGYNLWMHHVLGEKGERRFPKGKRLISHWNLRDELKANYAEQGGGADKQRTIVKVMERIVTQTIPQAVIDNPNLDWNPFTNEVTAAPPSEIEADAPAGRAKSPTAGAADAVREPDTRFAQVLLHFAAARRADAFAPTAPSHLARAFDGAEMPEERVRGLILALLESPMIAEAAKEVEVKLGRKLEPQDLWYEFGGGSVPEAELDAITRCRASPSFLSA